MNPFHKQRQTVAFALALAMSLPVGPSVALAAQSTPISEDGPAAWSGDTAGIPLVTELVTAVPTSEDQAQDLSDARVFAENHPDDVGYPRIDPASGRLEVSAASAVGSDILDKQISTFKTATEVREVQFSYARLEAIKDDVTHLHSSGVPDADLIYMVGSDVQTHRIVIVVSEPSARLFHELAERFGTEAIEVQIDASQRGATAAATRQQDAVPYKGGAAIVGVTLSLGCSDAFAWRSGVYYLLTAAHCVANGGNVNINGAYAGNVIATSNENWTKDQGTQYFPGDTFYRGDIALVGLLYNSQGYMYRSGPNSSSYSAVKSTYMRYMTYGDIVYVGGATTGETGPYTVDGINWYILYDCCPSDNWVRNITSAVRGTFDTCANRGDSGGSVFSKVTGGVKAAGVFSGFVACRIFFTDYYHAYLEFPGAAITT